MQRLSITSCHIQHGLFVFRDIPHPQFLSLLIVNQLYNIPIPEPVKLRVLEIMGANDPLLAYHVALLLIVKFTSELLGLEVLFGRDSDSQRVFLVNQESDLDLVLEDLVKSRLEQRIMEGLVLASDSRLLMWESYRIVVIKTYSFAFQNLAEFEIHWRDSLGYRSNLREGWTVGLLDESDDVLD